MSALVDLPPSARSKWISENTENILSVRYVRAPFGPGMPGETVDTAYINLLVHSNSAPAPTSDLFRLLRLDEHDRCRPGQNSSSTRPAPSANTKPGPKTMSTMPDKLIKDYKKVFEVIKAFNASRADSAFLSNRRRRVAAERSKAKKLKRDFVSGLLVPGLDVNAADDNDHTDDDVEEDENRGERMLFREDETFPEEQAGLPMAVLKRDIDICFRAIEEAKLRMMEKENMQKYNREYIYQTIGRYDALRRFMGDVKKLLIMLSSYDVMTVHSLDKGFFTQLFINFGWIFAIDFRLVTSFQCLVIGGHEVLSKPDIVLMESALSRLVVTVVEVKKDVGMISDHGHDTRKRKFSASSDVGHSDCDRDDIAFLSSTLRSQHACQLVCALPLTNAKNRMCMLGMIVQETKVRLTCLLMASEHLESLKHPNYDPAKYSAKIFYTRAYDMLNADDREHLINIMTTLASFQ
ncbi:uncharacterized protein LOC135484987 [Lineus longissimus]|uniref:uncharacterized protein LOC135484987 n=1 Tax=Lineus longissimus TaxID=88925 RepID=UPI002B4C9B13